MKKQKLVDVFIEVNGKQARINTCAPDDVDETTAESRVFVTSLQLRNEIKDAEASILPQRPTHEVVKSHGIYVLRRIGYKIG